jgi:hypothetical protein
MMQFAGSEDPGLEIPLDAVTKILILLKYSFHKVVDAMKLLITGILVAIYFVLYLNLVG